MLIIRLGAVGDVVRTLPAVSALRGAFAGAHLTWLVEPASRSAVEGQPWVDEVSLALVTDAWSRTYKSNVVMYASTADARRTRNGLLIVPDEVATNWPAERQLPAVGDRPPAKALDEGLLEIDDRYGASTADFVAMQLEYPK